jgi:hypothetical protein
MCTWTQACKVGRSFSTHEHITRGTGHKGKGDRQHRVLEVVPAVGGQ